MEGCNNVLGYSAAHGDQAMKRLYAVVSGLMLFLTIATLIAALAAYFAHKLRQRPRPAAEMQAPQSKEATPSLIKAYQPNRANRAGTDRNA